VVNVETQGLRKSFGDTEVLKGIDLRVPEGAFAVLVGPSGCGKSTLLRLLAGLEEASEGTILFGGEDVTTRAPKDRDVAMVFQSYALYPHMSVRDNLAFGLKLRKTPSNVITARVDEAAAVLGLEPLLDRFPRALSGGQRQRVAMGRAIVRRSKLFLFDEPLSNLDPSLRTQVRVDIRKQHDRLGATSIYVTHDQVEAMTLADLLFVLSEGEVQQSGSPLEVYEDPANRFVAGFVGSPAMNFIEGCRVSADGTAVHVGEHRLTLTPRETYAPAQLADLEVCVGVRPHDLNVVTESNNSLPFSPSILETLGPEIHAHGTFGAHEGVVAVSAEIRLARGVMVHVRPTRLYLFDQATGATLR
jgi:ABC-type sugar transport system ATPase subunit